MTISTLAIIVVAFGLGVPGGDRASTQLKDGQVHQLSEYTFEAWDRESQRWLTPEEFWQHYAARRGGLTWGSREDYPPYNDVNEHDTMIINLPNGPCLMEFFHSRWRRANDVRRWGDAFNRYGGCPHVFD